MPTYCGVLGTYELQERLGAGGNGEVWLAKGPNGNVAIKLLKKARNAPADAGPRFVQEVAALRRLAGVAGVLPLLDAPQDQPSSAQPWFAMPLAIPLRKQLGNDASLKDICQACAYLALALGRVHEQGIAHRDIKPDNLYWHDGQWCLGDFGLADAPDTADLTESGKKLGPAFYIAPEMLNHAATADGKKADVYSLGKTLWVLATGQTYPMPGVHDPTFAGGAIVTYRTDARSALLDELVRRMTLLDPARRPLVADIARELEILSRNPAMETAPDPDSSMKLLRAALVQHFTREQEEARQSALAEQATDSAKKAIEEVVRAIETETRLESTYWADIPVYWGYLAHMGGPQIESEDSLGYSFEAGGKSHTWRLGIGLKHQLLSNGILTLHIGYHFDYLINGHNANHMGMPRGWEDHGNAPNGTPSAHELAASLVAGLRQNLPDVLKRYADLVSSAPK